jgi:RNA polymerase sigma-70 factor, ECF subfamily
MLEVSQEAGISDNFPLVDLREEYNGLLGLNRSIGRMVEIETETGISLKSRMLRFRDLSYKDEDKRFNVKRNSRLNINWRDINDLPPIIPFLRISSQATLSRLVLASSIYPVSFADLVAYRERYGYTKNTKSLIANIHDLRQCLGYIGLDLANLSKSTKPAQYFIAEPIHQDDVDSTEQMLRRDSSFPAEFVQKLTMRDPEAFDILMRRYIDQYFRYFKYKLSNSDLAQEMTQELFYRVWTNIEDFELRGTPVEYWMKRIAKNMAIDHYRVKDYLPIPMGDQDHFLEDNGHPIDDEYGPEGLSRSREATGQFSPEMERIVNQLPELYQQVLKRRFIDDVSHNEVAIALGISPDYSRVLQFKALKRLREELEKRNVKDT